MAIQRITSGIIADGAIVATDIGDNTVTTSKIADANVTSSKLASTLSISGNFLANNITANTNIVANTGSAAAPSIFPTGDTNTGIFFPAADTIAFTTGGTARLNVDGSGRITTPNQVAFLVKIDSSPTAVADSTVPCNAEVYDVGNNYNTGTYTFTAPISGKYLLYYFIRYNSYAVNVYMHPVLKKNGATLSESHQIFSSPATNGSSAYISMSYSGVFDLAANDTIVLFDASQTSVNLGVWQANQTGFGGYLLG